MDFLIYNVYKNKKTYMKYHTGLVLIAIGRITSQLPEQENLLPEL